MMKVYEKPDVQVVVLVPNAGLAASFGDNQIPMLSIASQQP